MSRPSLGLADGMRLAGLSYHQLWVRYLELGGLGSMAAVRDHVESDQCPDPTEHKILAQVLNEIFVDRGHDHPVDYQHREPHPPAG